MKKKHSKIFDTKKGRGTTGKKTLCEVLRTAYDIVVVELYEKEPDICDKLIALIEDAWVMGGKMQKKMVENKIANDIKYENVFDVKKVVKNREERILLSKLIEDDNDNLKKAQYRHGKRGEKNASDRP